MKEKIVKIGIIAFLFVLVYTTIVNALSLSVTMTPSSTNVEKSKEFIVKFAVSNIDAGTNGINALSGILKYEFNANLDSRIFLKLLNKNKEMILLSKPAFILDSAGGLSMNSQPSMPITRETVVSIPLYLEMLQKCRNYFAESIDDLAIINYEEYSSLKNFYISGIKSLYTTTMTGGLLNYGKCESGSNDYIFNFSNTKLSKELSKEVTFDLELNEPQSMNSVCTIPKNSKNGYC